MPLIKEFVLYEGKMPSGLTIPMILHCPECGERHIDEAEFAEVAHHTHACQSCGVVWRPAKVCTHGAQFLPGYRNPLETLASTVCPAHGEPSVRHRLD